MKCVSHNCRPRRQFVKEPSWQQLYPSQPSLSSPQSELLYGGVRGFPFRPELEPCSFQPWPSSLQSELLCGGVRGFPFHPEREPCSFQPWPSSLQSEPPCDVAPLCQHPSYQPMSQTRPRQNPKV